MRTSRAAGRRGRINRHDRTDRIGDIVVGQSAGGAQNGGRDLETTFERHAGIKCYRTVDCRFYIPCGDLLIAFPDRQRRPSGGRKSLSKMRLVPLSSEEGPSVPSMDLPRVAFENEVLDRGGQAPSSCPLPAPTIVRSGADGRPSPAPYSTAALSGLRSRDHHPEPWVIETFPFDRQPKLNG